LRNETIEITVTGKTGSGKSEVLEVIANALNEFYRNGEREIVTGKTCKGAIEEAKTTKQTAKYGKVTFILNEENYSDKSQSYHRS